MKNFKTLFLTNIALIFSYASVYAMESSAGLKSSISDIKKYAASLTQKTGVTYKIVTKSNLFEKFLKDLGLSDTNTLLDIKYYYELMKSELLGQNELLKDVVKAYEQVMGMIFEVEKYKEDVLYLLKISFKDLQSMFEKQQQEYAVRHQVSRQFGLPLILQEAFNLSANASPHEVDKRYERYIEEYKDYSNKLIAHATMRTISFDDLKDSLDELEKVSKAYEQYVQKRGQK